jgi:imidazolonepropionase-like amidohydrolase
MATLVVRGGTLVDGTGRAPVRDATVLIEGERITAAGPSAQVPVPEGATVVEAAERTVIPGLIDMHVHTGLCREESFPLFLALGVTTIRDCAGDPVEVLPLRDRIAGGEVVGPRMFSMGPVLDGSPPTFSLPNPAGLRELRSVEEARAAAEELIDLGVDGLKLYATLPPDRAAAILDVARGRVPTTGHLSRTTSTEAIEGGISCLEHTHASIYQDIVQPEDRHPVDGGNGVMPNYWNWLAGGWARADLDAPHVRTFIELMAERDVSLCATLIMMTGGMLTEEAAEEPGLAYLPAYMRKRHLPENARRAWAERRAAGAEAGLPLQNVPPVNERARAQQVDFVRRAHEAGVRLAIGTDVGGASGQVPGFSMHREMAMHVEAGLSAHEVIQASTRACAEALWQQADLGTIEVGKLADLVVVEGDPLADLNAARNVVTVVANGVAHDAAALLEQARAVAEVSA